MSKTYTYVKIIYDVLFHPEKQYIRENTSGNLRKTFGQGYCVQTVLNTSFALIAA